MSVRRVFWAYALLLLGGLTFCVTMGVLAR